ncbi:type II secretion system F family protein [Candidatus Uhrbacteria bacterium]|nr:type II secretion system F family protein [Candidatus Uhrbacteria bacterium]
MTTFKYRVRAPDSSVQAGVVDAESREAAIEALNERGYQILLFEEQKFGEADIGQTALSFLNRIKPKELVVVSRTLSVMVSASVPIVDAIRNIARQSKNPRMQSMLSEVANEVEGGARLSDALEKHNAVWGDFFINMIRSGETSGQLNEVLEYLADQMEKDFDLNAKIKGAMIYPAFILTGLFVVGFIMMAFVVPKLTQILIEAKVPLPWTTKALIFTSNVFAHYWWLILILVGLAAVGFRAWVKTPGGKYVWDQFKMKVPIFGGLFQRIYVVRFCRSLSTLSHGGVDTVTALEIVSGVMGNTAWKQLVFETIREVNDGNSIITAMQRKKFVPAMVTQMLSVGEETGKQDEVFRRLSSFYAREIDNLVANMVSLIEPVIMIILGVGVGVLVSAILLPLYSMSSAI